MHLNKATQHTHSRHHNQIAAQAQFRPHKADMNIHCYPTILNADYTQTKLFIINATTTYILCTAVTKRKKL